MCVRNGLVHRKHIIEKLWKCTTNTACGLHGAAMFIRPLNPIFNTQTNTHDCNEYGNRKCNERANEKIKNKINCVSKEPHEGTKCRASAVHLMHLMRWIISFRGEFRYSRETWKTKNKNPKPHRIGKWKNYNKNSRCSMRDDNDDGGDLLKVLLGNHFDVYELRGELLANYFCVQFIAITFLAVRFAYRRRRNA